MDIREYFYSLLRKSEKYIKTDMVYLAKGGFWLVFGQVMASFSTFLLAIAYANFLPKEAYGTYKYILSIAGMLSALTLAGMGTAVVRAVAQGAEGTLRSAFFLKLRWSIGMVIMAIGGALYYYLQGNTVLGLSLLIIAFFFPLTQSATLYGSYLNGKKDFRKQSTYDMLSTLSVAVLVFITIIATKDPLYLVLSYFAGTALMTLFFFLKTSRNIPRTAPSDPSALGYGKHLSLMGVLSAIAGNIDSFLLWHFLGPIALAVYSFALAIPKQIKAILGTLTTLALPKLAQRTSTEIRQTLPRRMLAMFVVVLIITAAYILAAPYIYKFLFPQYTDSIFYSQLMALVLLLFPTSPIHVTLTAHADKKRLYALSIATPLTKIILLFILLPHFGILGAVIAMLGSQALSSIMLLTFFKKMI